MAVGDDNTVDLIFTAQTEEAAAKAKALATGVESDLQGIAAQPAEIPLETDQAEAAVARLVTEVEGLRAEVLTPTLLEIDSAAASESVAAVGVSVEELGAELAAVGEAGAALSLAAPFVEALPAVEGLRGEVEGLLPPLEELPAAIDPALAAIEAGFLSASAAVENFEVKAEAGSKRIQQPMTAARIAVIQLKDAIAALGPESAESVAVLEERLRELEARIDSGTEAWGRFRAQARISAIELKEVAIQSGAAHGSLDDLVEGSLSKFPKMEQGIFKVVSALTVLQLAYSETRHLVEKLKEIGGPDIDEGIQNGMIWLLEEVTLQHIAQNQLADSTEHLLALDRLLAAHQAELTAAKITYVHTVESETEALKKLEEYHQSIEVKAREFVETVLESAGAVEKERKTIELGLPVLLQRGVLTAASSDLIIGRLNAEIEAMKRLGEETADIEKTRDALEKMSRALKLDESITDLKRYAIQVEESGKITKEEADKIVAEAAKIIKSIRELPPEEQKAMAVRLDYLIRLEAGYDRFTTAHAALLKKQAENAQKEADAEAAILKRREDQTRTFLESLRGLLAKPLTGPTVTGGGTQELAAAKAELAALEKTSSAGLVSQQDLERMAELKAKIADLGAPFGSLTKSAHGAAVELGDIGSAGQAAAQKAREALVTLLGKSDEFAAALKGMSATQQAELLALTDGFLSDLGGGLIKGEEGIADFVGKFTGILQASGAVSSKFGTEMAAAFGTGTASLDALFNAASGTASGLQGVQGEVTILSTAMGEFVAGSATATEAAKQTTAATKDEATASQEAVVGYIRRAEAAKDLVTVNVKLKQDEIEIVNHTKDAAAATVVLVDENQKAAESAHTLSDGLGLLPEQINQIADELTPAAEGVRLFQENLKAVGPLVGVFQQPAADAGKLAESAPKAADGVGAIGKAVGDAAPLMKAMSTEAGGDTEAIRLMRVQVQGLHGDLGALNAVMAATVKLCGDLNKCRAGAA